MSPPSAKILKTDDCNNLKENPYIFQEQLWFNIFLRCDGDSLKKLFLVCKEFNRLLSWNGFWLEKCLQDRVNLPPKKWREFILKDTDKLFNYRIMWYKNPYNRNLAYKFTKADHLANLCESNRRMTFVVYNGGDGMLIEKEDDFLFRDDRVECCFATSYGWCTRFFELDLEECGLEPWIIDEIRPNITVKELCCCRNDCGAIYKTHSYLLLPEERFDRRTEKESRCRSVTKSWEQWEGGFEWEEAKMVFSDYCAGVRHFSMETSGKDTQFWAGHYGSKFANTEVIITFPDETRLLAPEEYKEPDTKPKPEIMPSRYNIPGFVRRLRNFRRKLMAVELTRSEESNGPVNPITALCFIADKNKCPKGFTAITKATDDNSDADLWRESSFSIFARPTRYIAYSKELPDCGIKGTAVSVITDITVIKDSEPIPHGYVAIDYTADSREKSLRKRVLCIKSESREAVVDAIGEITVLGKTKKTPKVTNGKKLIDLFSEVDGALIVFKVVVIPQTFGLKHSSSAQSLPTRSAPAPPNTLYPALQTSSSTTNFDKVNAFTIKSPNQVKPKGVDGVPFKLHPSVGTAEQKQGDDLPQINFDIRRLDTEAFYYTFAIEQATLASAN